MGIMKLPKPSRVGNLKYWNGLLKLSSGNMFFSSRHFVKVRYFIGLIGVVVLFAGDVFAQYVCEGNCVNGNGFKKAQGSTAYMKGKFKEGVLTEGTVSFPNGDMFVGKFRDNFLEEGFKFFHTGRQMEGSFYQNILVVGKITEPDGSSRIIKLRRNGK